MASNLAGRLARLEKLVAEKLAIRNRVDAFAMIISEMVNVGPDDDRYQEFYNDHPHSCKMPTISVSKLSRDELIEKYMVDNNKSIRPTVVVFLPENNRGLNK